jgi:hypothetical protein
MKILISLLFLSTKLIAACLSVNNFDTSDKLRNLKIVNQGDMSTCYAHSLAALYNIDQEHEGKFLHPYWIAYSHKNTNTHWSPKDMDYSLLIWAWADMRKNQMCDFSKVRQIVSDLKNTTLYSDDQLFYLFKAFFKTKDQEDIQTVDTYNLILKETFTQLLENSKGFEIEWTEKDIRKVFDPLQKTIADKKLFEFLEEDVFHACHGHMSNPLNDMQTTAMKAQSNEEVLSSINQELLLGKSMAVGYCSKPVYKNDPRSSADIGHNFRLFKSFSKKCSAHYSLLVGSRKTKKRCELLVRNSYGEGFWAHESMTCYCENRQTQEKFNCTKKQSAGHKVLGCWIGKEKLLNNTFDISYFK